MRFLWLAVLFAGASGAQPDARELVRRSIANGERSWKESFDYFCVKRQTEMTPHGPSIDVYDVIPLGDGASFEELVEHDNEPLPAAERLKIKKELERRSEESPAQKHHRFEKEVAERSYMKEVPDAFDFKIVGEENLPTGPAWVLKATPRPGFVPHSRYAHAFSRMRGSLWIDKKDVQWVKAEAEAADNVTFGLFLARLSKGSRIILEQTRLPDGTWVPKRLSAKAAARTFIVFNHVVDENITYSDYRKREALSASGAR